MTMTRWFTPSRPAAPPTAPPAPTSVADRQAVVDAVAAERTRYAEVSRRLGAEVARTQARADEIAALHRDATARRDEAQAAALSASLAHTQRIATLEARLTAGAPEVIDRFLADLVAEDEQARAAVDTRVSDGHAHPVTGARPMITVTNAPSVERRLAAIRAARAAAAALRLEALPEAEILARLTALQAEIPEVELATADLSWLHSPGELRQAEWHAQDSLARRWSSPPREWGD